MIIIENYSGNRIYYSLLLLLDIYKFLVWVCRHYKKRESRRCALALQGSARVPGTPRAPTWVFGVLCEFYPQLDEDKEILREQLCFFSL